MSYTSLLINTGYVLTDTGTTADAYGVIPQTWTAGSAVDCRLMATGAVEIIVGGEVVIADYKLFLEDITITEQNRFRVSAIDYEILQVADRQDDTSTHHKECRLRAVR